MAGRTRNPPVPPSMAVWRSVRATGDTKTRLSRRTLALPARCVEVLMTHRGPQDRMRLLAGKSGSRWGWSSPRASAPRSTRPTSAGTSAPPSAGRQASTPTTGLRGSCGTPSSRCSLTAASRSRRSPGSSGTAARWSPRLVYRKQLRPVIQSGATVMDRLFSRPQWQAIWQAAAREQQEARPLRRGTGLWPAVMLVGDTGIEPVTSSVSRKRSPTELIARARRHRRSVEVETGFEPV